MGRFTRICSSTPMHTLCRMGGSVACIYSEKNCASVACYSTQAWAEDTHIWDGLHPQMGQLAATSTKAIPQCRSNQEHTQRNTVKTASLKNPTNGAEKLEKLGGIGPRFWKRPEALLTVAPMMSRCPLRVEEG